MVKGVGNNPRIDPRAADGFQFVGFHSGSGPKLVIMYANKREIQSIHV